jgi:pyruvate dehydrogenase E2 component (dihydrolipoamide acetyltransferase)
MDVKVPNLGEGVDSGAIRTIYVKVGDEIKKDDPIIELESEKAVASLPSPVAGTITKIHIKEGDTVKVGQPVISVEEAGVGVAAVPAARAEPLRTAAATPIPGIPPPASPSVRKLARELGIDLTSVRGSEPGGRITMADLRAYVQQPQKPVAERIDFSKWGPVTKQPVTPLRKTIARRMHESWSAVPRVTQFDEADMTGLNELRKKFAAAYEAKGARLTLTVFAMKAVVATLKKHAIFNSSLDEAAGEIVLKQYYHIGVAVDTEHGLLVPVVRDVDKKSMFELAKELEELAGKARDRKLSAEQMKGGTFTISNQGGIGSGAFTPVVNLPEVAILGMGRGALKPVVVAGKIEPRLILPLALSYDHRAIDGANAARFMVDLVAEFQKFTDAEVKI